MPDKLGTTGCPPIKLKLDEVPHLVPYSDAYVCNSSEQCLYYSTSFDRNTPISYTSTSNTNEIRRFLDSGLSFNHCLLHTDAKDRANVNYSETRKLPRLYYPPMCRDRD